MGDGEGIAQEVTRLHYAETKIIVLNFDKSVDIDGSACPEQRISLTPERR
jgi:hypothetical protein